MQFSHALNPRRISRSLVTVFILTFIQNIAAPLVAPELSTPAAKAAPVSTTYNYTSFTSGTTFTVPTGVTSINLQVRGGAGGPGGDDGTTLGLSSSVVGYVSAQFVVTPGDVIQIFPGNVGTDGGDGVRNSGGGTGGVSTVAASPLNINGTYIRNLSFAGGAGGKTGDSGSSGGGGGGGGASVVAINYKVVLIAGGGGGGGGAGNGSSNSALPYTGTSYTSGGGAYVGATGANPGSSDGGGGGGGGGGWFGGAGGAAQYRSTEYAGVGGSYGGNYVDASGTASLNSTDNPQGVGMVNITYMPDEASVCATDVQNYDIYTIVKVTQVDLCTWSVPSTVSVIDFFSVGGGGGGGGDGGGGGGGGAALSRTAIAVTPNSSVELKVGYGGMGGSWGGKFNPITGASTVITLASGTAFTALGGTAATTVQGAAGGAGGVASNGGFSGGAGGAGNSTSGGVGTAGKTGISNYFYGVQNTYGGGGGGGATTNSAVQTPAAGASGGGAGGYASSSSVNQPGSNGADNRGGGGGGGLATGSGEKLFGGKGGSGVILIRYATNAADAFPATLTSALAGRYTPGDLQLLDSSRKGWIDSSGTNASVSNTNITSTGLSITSRDTTDSTYATGSSKNLQVIKGTPSSQITIANLNTNYTLFHIARYVRGGTAQKIFTASGNDWTSGYYWGEGVAYHYNWLTADSRSLTYKWQLTTDQQYVLRANGVDNASQRNVIGTQLASVNNFGINNFNYASDFEVADILIFNRELSIGEVNLLERYLARVNGLTLDSLSYSTETDTAADLTSAQYYYGNYDIGNQLSDTFTIQAWVNFGNNCATGLCQIFVKESAVLLGVDGGTLRWSLQGKEVGGWGWIDTGVKFPVNEWHHVSMVKQFTGDKNGSLLFYLDGELVYTVAGSPYGAATNNNSTSASYALNDGDTTWMYLGTRSNATQRFYGYLDEVKVWRGPRTAEQIKLDMHSNDTSSAQLQMYYDFNKPGASTTTRVMNLAINGVLGTDLYTSSSIPYSDVKQVAVSSNTPFTTITFPRTYINQYGGWKVPANVSQVQAVLIGGGGGGGGGFEGGGGGAGGFIETLTTLNSGETYRIQVGTGGRGTAYPLIPTNGESSTAFGITTLGGGSGAVEFNDGGNNVQYAPGSGGSGGGGSWSLNFTGGSGTYAQGNNGGNSSALQDAACGTGKTIFAGGGGGGAGAPGQDASCLKGGNGGAGKSSTVLDKTVAAGGGGSVRPYERTIDSSFQGVGGTGGGGKSAYTSGAAVGATGGATSGNYGTGSGGGAGYAANGTSGYGASGGSGIVALRYITATKPSYTKPTTAYLNAGMTETFTTNVAIDSATAGLTRTFKWESTTPTSGGVYTTLKVGTGAANAAYSWVPSDTSTTGSGYLYRLTVTDSDTAGLFITDSSTAYAIINPALNVSGTSAIVKKINIARNETFTITLGTPTYRASLSPVIAGITLDTSTAGSPVLKIAETATVGTWLETLTVTDSVSASISFPLTITVAAPPTLINTGEVVTTGQVFAIDAASSASYNRSTGAWSDISGSKRAITVNSSSGTPLFSDDNSGVIKFDGTKYQALYTSGIGELPNWTIDTWIRIDEEPGSQRCAVTSEYVPNVGFNYFMCIDAARTIFTGFYIPNGWTYMRTTQVVPLNTWVHLVGTWNGSKVKLYIDGVLAPGTEIFEGAGLVAPGTASQMTYIAKWYDSGIQSSAAYYSPISAGSVRIYNLALTETQTAQNYNATKERFAPGNLTQLKPTQKYGALTIESFTATSGYGARNFSLSASSPSGIEWDGSVTDRLTVSVQESLTVGTYYDTMTVTDSLGQSSYLPITFTVTKADTLTVTMGSPLTVVYNGLVPSAAPKASISGLVGVDTATVLTRYDTATIGTTCATGGVCKIGDTGPGGGKVFYISDTTINAATGISEGGVYLEVAPLGWHTTQGQEEALAWSSVSTAVPGTLSDIGAGAENSRLVYSQLGASSAGFNVIVNKTIGGKSDWFVPSLGELEKVYENLWATGLDSFTSSRNVLSSTENPSNTSQAMQVWNVGGIVAGVSKTTGFYMRPIRAFGGTTTPTESDSYTAQGHNLTFGVGAASNYVNVVYETSTLKITQANQEKLIINLYGAVAGAPFTLQISGGSGTGFITETVTAGSTAINCRISNRELSNDTPATEQKACNIAITKAASRNYKSETLNATVYFMMFVNNQPTGQVGSGSTIALNGVTSFETSTVAPPTVTGITFEPSMSIMCPNGMGFCFLSNVYAISGSGFGTNFNTQTKVKFSRNKIVDLGSTLQSGAWVDGDTRIILTGLPAGISPGRVVVITPNGEGVSDFTFTP